MNPLWRQAVMPGVHHPWSSHPAAATILLHRPVAAPRRNAEGSGGWGTSLPRSILA